jgi:hypothetical protein
LRTTPARPASAMPMRFTQPDCARRGRTSLRAILRECQCDFERGFGRPRGRMGPACRRVLGVPRRRWERDATHLSICSSSSSEPGCAARFARWASRAPFDPRNQRLRASGLRQLRSHTTGALPDEFARPSLIYRSREFGSCRFSPSPRSLSLGVAPVRRAEPRGRSSAPCALSSSRR